MKKNVFKTVAATLLLSMFCGCSFLNEIIGKEDEESELLHITFENDRFDMNNGEHYYLKYFCDPPEFQGKVPLDFKYDSNQLDIEPDDYGVILKAKKSGTTVFQVYTPSKHGGYIADTALIRIFGSPTIYEGEKYIYSDTTALEMHQNEKVTVSASIYGGTVSELQTLNWQSNNIAVATVEYARGSCIITARGRGSAKITISSPVCPFEYTMIVFVGDADANNPCYLTTSENIICINKAETAERNVQFEIRNPLTLNYYNDWHYEALDKDGNPSEEIFSVVGNRPSCIITPKSNGLGILRVTKPDMCEYPLDVLVKVSTTIENVYIDTSTTMLEVKGSENSYNFFAEVKGTDKFVDPDKFTFEIVPREDDKDKDFSNYFDYKINGNQFNIIGKKNCIFTVKVGHELSEYKRNVLVVLREQIGSAIDASMYITTTENYVQMKVGDDTKVVQVTMVGGEAGDENELRWYIENGANNDVCLIETPHGNILARAAGTNTQGNVYITPKTPGTAKISVKHDKILDSYESEIIVKVLSQYALTEEPMYINSNVSVVKMLNSESTDFSVMLDGNVKAGDENGVTWTSENTSVIDVNPTTGVNVVLQGRGSGENQVYVTAHHERAIADKKILVVTADTQEALDAMKGFYADTTYARLNVNGDIYVEMKSFGLEESDIRNIRWTSDNSSICIVNADSENRLRAKVSGISSGVTTVKASLNGLTDCVFNITVLPEGEDVLVNQLKYLTTTQNAIVITEVGSSQDVKVDGIGIEPSSMQVKTIWESQDSEIATVNANGQSATITAVKEGKTKVKVSNEESLNDIYIDVKVGALYEWADDFFCYITTENDTVTLVKGSSTRIIGAALENSTAQGGFSWSIDKPNLCEIAGTADGTCALTPIEAGMTELTIRNVNCEFEKKILIVIANSEEEVKGVKYLTTTQNVITVGEANNFTASVSVKNADSEILDGFVWTSSNEDIAKVISSGSHAVVYGIKQGTAKITVSNDIYCRYPLEIIVNVVDPILAAAHPYIASQNILTVYMDDDKQKISASLIGGKESDNSAFSWSVQDNSIVDIQGINEECIITPKKAGVTQVIISHPKAGGIDRNVLIIVESAARKDYAITISPSTVIKMSPNDSAKTITATLVGSDVTNNDNYLFKWWADDYSIIDMESTGSYCVITPVAAGSTVIRCSHPKAAVDQQIILNITQYSELAFNQTSVSCKKGKQSFVNIQVPTSNISTKVVYEVTDTRGNPSEILSASGTKSVCVLEPREVGQCIVTAKLVATNSGIEQGKATLLVNIEESEEEVTYIDYQGSTIIHLRKGEKRSLSALIKGANSQTNDEANLRWKVQDSNILNISPRPGADGNAVGREVEITAVAAGQDTTVTITHPKTNSSVIVYVICDGENVATVDLNYNLWRLIKGSDAFELIATIRNAEPDDYDDIKWTIEQDENNKVLEKTGSGRKISLYPKNVGIAVVTAEVPSSKRTASCTIEVEPPRSITFDKSKYNTYPCNVIDIPFHVEPESERDTVKFTFSTNTVREVSYKNEPGHVYLQGCEKEGTCVVTATTASGVKTSFVVENSFGDNFAINKSRIKAKPVYTNDGTFRIDYEVKPKCAKIHIIGLKKHNARVKEGDYTKYNDVTQLDATGDDYIIEIDDEINKNTPAIYNPETGVSTGSFEIIPDGEGNATGNEKIQIIAVRRNPIMSGGTLNGEQVVIGRQELELLTYYDSYTFDLNDFHTDGSFSRYQSGNSQVLYMGDGETASYRVRTLEENATPVIKNIEFDDSKLASVWAIAGNNAAMLKNNIEYNATYDPEQFVGSIKVCNDFTVRAKLSASEDEDERKIVLYRDFNSYEYPRQINYNNNQSLDENKDIYSGKYYNLFGYNRTGGEEDLDERYIAGIDNVNDQRMNPTMVGNYFIGNLKITYNSRRVSGDLVYKIPIYLEIRNCPYNYTK